MFIEHQQDASDIAVRDRRLEQALPPQALASHMTFLPQPLQR
ncbi:MAG: hypothetical protein ABGZ53_28065 [Fuerstiella sp.]